MLSVTGEFLEALARPHRMIVTARAWYPGQTPIQVPVLGGQVQVDEDAECTRTLTLEIPHSLRPTDPKGPIGKNGQRIQIERGIEFPDGTQETVPLGTFRINSWSKPRLGKITLDASSVESIIIGDRLTTPTTVSGPSVIAVIRDLITDAWPDAPITVQATKDAPCPTTTFEDSRIDAIRELCRAISVQMITDAFGRFVIRDMPSVGDPVWSVKSATVTDVVYGTGIPAAYDDPIAYDAPIGYDGSSPIIRGIDVDLGTLLDATDQESRANVANSVTARGENLEGDAPPVQATVSVTDPDSPFYADPDAYGVVRRFYASPLLTTTGQCEQAATTILQKQLSQADQESCEAIVNPALECGDTVGREDADGTIVPVILQSFTIPLTATEHMPMTTRGDGEQYELT